NRWTTFTPPAAGLSRRYRGRILHRRSHGLNLGSRDVGPGQEIVDLAVGVAVDDPGKRVGQVGERFDVVQLARLNQRSDDGPVLGAVVRSGKEGVLAVECDRTD